MYGKRGTGEFTKFRLLISGLTQTGKTHSLITFLYGDYDYWDDEERSEAIEFAGGKTMAIIVCPGEVGIRSLPRDTEQLTSYYDKDVNPEDFRRVEYSRYALNEFNETFQFVEKERVDIVFLDGIHELYNHIFNDISNGEWLSGADMSINPKTGETTDKYRAARFHDTAQKTFINYLNMYYNSPIPFFGMTTWEEWKSGTGEQNRPGGVETKIEARRYLWPAMAGAMAIKCPGKFDARLSARMSMRCLHQCDDSKHDVEHHVWQFVNRDDVMGVGVKGLRITPYMQKCPFIHQSWTALQALLQRV